MDHAARLAEIEARYDFATTQIAHWTTERDMCRGEARAIQSLQAEAEQKAAARRAKQTQQETPAPEIGQTPEVA